MEKLMIPENMGPFATGEPRPKNKNFSGKVYFNQLVREPMPVDNVTFAPGCRNSWHIHHGGGNGVQVLLCTYGNGWYQEWAKPARALRAGDVVVVPHGVKHWHGAAKNSWLAHLSIKTPADDIATEWLEPVSDAEYDRLG